MTWSPDLIKYSCKSSAQRPPTIQCIQWAHDTTILIAVGRMHLADPWMGRMQKLSLSYHINLTEPDKRLYVCKTCLAEKQYSLTIDRHSIL